LEGDVPLTDFLLLLVMIGIFLSGYFAVSRIGVFLEKVIRPTGEADAMEECAIWIASRNPVLIGSAAEALAQCRSEDLDVEFYVCNGDEVRLLHLLEDGSVRIMLLTNEELTEEPTMYEYIQIPCMPVSCFPHFQ
jgi:hypothetical protein